MKTKLPMSWHLIGISKFVGMSFKVTLMSNFCCFFSFTVLHRCNGNTSLRLPQNHHVEDEVINTSTVLSTSRHTSDIRFFPHLRPLSISLFKLCPGLITKAQKQKKETLSALLRSHAPLTPPAILSADENRTLRSSHRDYLHPFLFCSHVLSLNIFSARSALDPRFQLVASSSTIHFKHEQDCKTEKKNTWV